MPWNNFNPSFSLSRDSTATDDDTTVTKEGWNSDPNCYSPQLGSYAQETLLVNTSLSNTQLQAALWTKWGSHKESERRKGGSNLQWLTAITPPRPRNIPGHTASPSDTGHGHTLGKHQIQLCRTGFGVWGPQLCSAVEVISYAVRKEWVVYFYIAVFCILNQEEKEHMYKCGTSSKLSVQATLAIRLLLCHPHLHLYTLKLVHMS